MVEKWDPVLGNPGPLGPPVPQDPMNPRDAQDVLTLGPPETSGPFGITSTV